MDEVRRTYFHDIKVVSRLSNLPWDKLSGKNILITGATGLIGGCLVDILMNRENLDFHVYASGRNLIRAERRFCKYKQSKFFHFIEMDVTEKLRSTISFHYILSCASGANPLVYSQRPVDTMMANILGVDNLIRYGIDNNLEKFVYVSSGDVYGEGDGRVFTEDYSGYVNPMVLRSCYPSAKRASESLCVSYAAQYAVDINVVRPCHIYGPGFTESDSRAYAQFLRNAVAGKDIILKSSGTQLRSWCYVVDCASAILHVALLGISGEAYNIADNDSNLSIKEFAETVASAAGAKVMFDVPNKAEVKGFNTVTQSLFDTKKIEALGWLPISNFKDNICVTIDYLLHNEDNDVADDF